MKERVRAGQPLNISASDWNAAMEATEIVLGGKLNRRGYVENAPRGNQDILCRNATNTAFAQFSVVGLSDVVEPLPDDNLPEFKQQQNIIEAVVPVFPDHVGKWGILQEPLAADAVGRVRVAGISIVEVTGAVDCSYGDFAEMIDGDESSLERKANGSAQILWTDGDTDWCIVRIGNLANETFFFKSASGGIPGVTGTGPWTPGSATCTLCERYLDGSTIKFREVSPTVSITVYNSSPTATAGSKLGQGKWISGLRFVDVIECA